MANFKRALSQVTKIEGGYSNRPNDKGGETYAGIARRWHGDWDGWEVIDQIKERMRDRGITYFGKVVTTEETKALNDLVNDFYHTEYWLRMGLSSVHDQKIATQLLMYAIHKTPFDAAIFAQQSINQLISLGILDLSHIKEDGHIGAVTRARLQDISKDPKIAETFRYLFALKVSAHYIDTCRKDNTQSGFLRGWLRRAFGGV